MYLDPIGGRRADGVIEATPTPLGCFDSARTAQTAITDGAPRVVVIGSDWKGEHYTGAQLIWTAHAGCTSNRSYKAIIKPDTGWQGKISSAKGKSGCNRYRHCDGFSCSAASITCSPRCPTMGAMDDRTLGERFRHG
jgi:hypothetical protein